MAEVSLSPVPHNLSSMSTSGRRVPLSNNANAVNSPYRSNASKQKRSYATIQREEAYNQPHPAKKQMLEYQQSLKTPPRQLSTQSSIESRVLTRRSQNSTQSSFERRNVAVRERSQQMVTKADRSQEGALERLRWQKHHRKLFPSFVFYFESVPEELRLKYAKQVVSLGSRVEKFFSKDVTHVVTSRRIPNEPHIISTDISTNSSIHDSQLHNGQTQTINPLLLDRSSESTNSHSDLISKSKFTFEAPSGKRLLHENRDGDAKQTSIRSADVLHRAREMGMKLWALEKLSRMMTAMFDTESSVQALHGHNTRSNSVQCAVSFRGGEKDLSQLLRNERINGPSDRDPTVATKELTMFKGPFIYIHDIDEKQRPIMVREYAKVSCKEQGDWPQFRSVSGGKCPFIEENDNSKAERDKELLRLQRQQEKEKVLAPRSRQGTVESKRMQPPKVLHGRRILAETDDRANRNASTKQDISNPQSKASVLPQMDREPSSQRSQNAFVSRTGTAASRVFAGEPVASGVQPSNITSAIRSTITSSAAAQPGIKAGTSKEVHGLQRKVLEKNSGGPGSYGLTSSHRMTDMSTAVKEETAAVRSSRLRGPEVMALIEEDAIPSEIEEQTRKTEASRKFKAVQQRKQDRRDPKPGYCENCQDKFEDFDEHVMSRKHRRFAEKLENWKELDELLEQLRRPRREYEEDES